MSEVFSCCQCLSSFLSFSLLTSHYRQFHEYLPNPQIVCNVNNCKKVYRNVKCLKRHIMKHHSLYYNKYCRKNSDLTFSNTYYPDPEKLLENKICDYDDDQFVSAFDIDYEIFNFFINLKEVYKVPWNVCSYAGHSFSRLISRIKNKILFRNMNQQSETEFKLTFENVVRQNMNELEYSLQHFSDIYNLNNYLRSIPQMVYPVGYTLDKTSSMNSIQYVPILKTLETLLNHDEVLNEVLLCHHSEFSDIQDFCDSRNYSENLLFSHNPTALQIQLYYDDITLGNALGSRVKQSKMAMFYFSLGNIRPKYRSALHTIQLVLICNASLIKNHLSEVLLPFLTDIKTLETEGIKVIKNNVIHCFKGTVSFISADNLAAHALGRFDSFNSHRACRKCLITKVERNIVLHEDDCTLRTRVAYDRQSRDANVKLYGLIGCSPFKDLRYFHIIDGLPFDIAHDWFEGIIPFVLNEFICFAVKKFPNGKFTPKFHHAIHFPNQLLKFGPSLLHSTIRYEGKHLTFKEMYQSSKNKKNISYSLAVRHGILQCALLNADKYLIKNIETTNGRLINLNLLPENCQNALSLHSERNMLVFSASKITSKNGITFNIGCALITEFYDDICSFAAIKHCIIIKENIYLVLQKLKTIKYFRHFNSYAVEALDNYYVCSSADIINTDELGLYKCYEGNKNYHLITLKYLPAECKSVENILEKEQSVYPDASCT
ncbi:hypothetical protein Avbf_17757 [Armadillidium vulgare]|nr:hypothetical protein Avbf_17757 [Armadillidium vulgare]